MTKKHPALIVLEALLQGQTIKVDKRYKHAIGELNNGTKVVSFVCKVTENGKEPREELKYSFMYEGLTTFINDCEQLSEEQITAIASDVALNKIKEDIRE